MGSFASTCCVSGLPIEAGDPVRFFLLQRNPYVDRPGSGRTVGEMHGRWVPRTWPICAVYNDHGSVEQVQEGSERDVWMDGLALDLVEVGVGDNSVHDAATSRDMSFDALLDALWEWRVLVRQDVGESGNVDAPSYVPTLRSVTEALSEIEVKPPNGYMVDAVDDGVRVRWGGKGDDWNTDSDWLGRARAVLDGHGFACVITAGSGNYSRSCDLRVYAAPGTTADGRPHRIQLRSDDDKPPLLVGVGMIREDVWQALVGLDVEAWWGVARLDDCRRTATAALRAVEQSVVERSALMSAGIDPVAVRWLSMMSAHGQEPGGALLEKDAIPFTVGLSTHASLLLDRCGDVFPNGFADVVAEFTQLHHVLREARYVWRPMDTAGPQFGEWAHQARLLGALHRIAEAGADQAAAELAAVEAEDE